MIAGIILSIFSWIPCGNPAPSGVALWQASFEFFFFIVTDHQASNRAQKLVFRRPWIFFFSNFRLIILKLIHKVQRTVQCNGDPWKIDPKSSNCPRVSCWRRDWGEALMQGTWCPGREVTVVTAYVLAVLSSFVWDYRYCSRKDKEKQRTFPSPLLTKL